MKVFVLGSLVLFSLLSWGKEISLSFDDAPRGNTAYLKGIDRTHKLIEALKKDSVRKQHRLRA